MGFADNVPQHILLYLIFLYSISLNLFSYSILSLNNSEAFGLPDNVGQSILFLYSFNNSIASGLLHKLTQYILLLFSFNISIAFGFPDNQSHTSLSLGIQSLNTYLVGNKLLYFSTIFNLKSSGNLFRVILEFILFLIDFGDEFIFPLKTLIYLQNFVSCLSLHSKTLDIILIIILLPQINS